MKKSFLRWVDTIWFFFGFIVIGYCIYSDVKAYYLGGSAPFFKSFIASLPNYIIWSVVIYLTGKNKPWRIFRKSAA